LNSDCGANLFTLLLDLVAGSGDNQRRHQRHEGHEEFFVGMAARANEEKTLAHFSVFIAFDGS
jgi:hypothetical protein